MKVLTDLLLAAALCAPALAQGTRAVIRSDYLVNTDTVGYSGQHYPASAADRAGNFVVAWQDARNGDVDIFARRYDSGGTPLGPSFRVNDDAAAVDQARPHLAVAGDGRFVVAWTDPRDGLANIYAQRYGADGSPLGGNILVCEEDGYSSQDRAKAAINDQGEFIIVWHDDRDGEWRAYAHRFDSAGVSLGADFRVDDTPDYVPPYDHLAAAMDGAGGFVVAWADYRAGNVNVRARMFENNGAPVDTSFLVNTYLPGTQGDPGISMSWNGGFVIAWHDWMLTSDEISAQRYDAEGVALGGNFIVNDQTNTVSGAPGIACDSAGNFTVAWDDDRGYDDGVYAQRYNSAGAAQGSNFRVSNYYYNDRVSVAMGRTGGFHVFWEELSSPPIVRSRGYDSAGTPQGSSFQVDDHYGASAQTGPAVSMSRYGDFSVIWDHRKYYDNYHMLMQLCDAAGDTVSGNLLVEDTVSVGSASVAAIPSGGWLAAWIAEDGRALAQEVRRPGGGGRVQDPGERLRHSQLETEHFVGRGRRR